MNPLLKCHLACGSTEASQTGTDSTHTCNAAKQKEGQTYESSSARAVSFAYRRALR